MSKTESQVYNLAAESLETKRIPYPYHYVPISKGKLLNADTNETVEDNIEIDTYLGCAEYTGFIKLQNWFNRNESGIIIWISPPYYGVYQDSKIIVSEIVRADNIKILFNRAIVMDDLTSAGCVLFARDINPKVEFSIEGLRQNPIPIDENINWLETLSHCVDVTIIRDYIESGRDLLEKEKAVRQARTMVKEAERLGTSNLYDARLLHLEPEGFYGTHEYRCKPRTTAFQKVFSEALFIGKAFECPKCHQDIPSGRGITVCPHCGAKKEDFGNKCD